ncbi:GTP cyclohydrolase I FolE [Deinococcus radiodurans]|uniref:GTP cyclohydrolase 1 n=1 Tax=Deinococcus radiodurans (strain ATCC 13939 / DSM 20539 / JCM 16871 / CCUG 27074 / LMG 4051 / NBRC 15346 / NCIMB 9279 / VKM B-1422 / R1) TaxID=243230 RepID=GCH1_DEIRA|nr:RecName: Full=GTP cyclohydrolase 1; AltName: Full=GTP cyclohydrolase I; Short=GTP-CH-I [Deinococcus radiodurans R1 = ATCC 13939 = DSM 20539]QEM72019.1 GTP cyclohydrolase I FolE [Deinococcus radiodurans]AAF09628.1 GTP cyclohydrolase I [Deinococcus radiodurans R1 = ATCC 13939 = DSM 20539]QIP28289.1 GTP cyclohydrolase I FolE [Deinococcus radiodurans]QIP30835.1 GTP cyclohydrolase I FolE [Deinococcus radiodurans]UDK99252.1 GTP cyclohydrolase I FolE [Deinococcus radiodurans R1 = ATCC 13939 = DSM 
MPQARGEGATPPTSLPNPSLKGVPLPDNPNNLEPLTREWLAAIGEDPDREGLQRTPQRVAKAWAYMTEGYGQTLAQVVGEGVFAAEGSEMVIVKDIEFYSMCEHHMLPFYGRAHVAYIPGTRILGLSKFARIVDLYSRRLQVQERITTQVADAVEELLAPKGVAVLMEGIHLCMAMRGVQKQNSSTTTSAMRGLFRSDPRTRAEFMSAVQGTLRGR